MKMRDSLSSASRRRRLSWRVPVVTLVTMLVTGLLVFLPAISRERRHWIEARLLAAEIAALVVPAAPPPPGTPAAAADSALRADLLRLAGAVSIRLQEGGRPAVVLSSTGTMVQAPVLVDMRRHRPVAGLLDSIGTLLGGERTLLVFGPSLKRPGATVSAVLQEVDLVAHLRGRAGAVALQGLGAAAITGLLVQIALRLLLVVPARRIAGSITAFRADPEHTPPLDPRTVSRLKNDEMALAGEGLSALQHDLRIALWHHARMAALGAAIARISHDLRGVLSPAMLAAERLQANPDAKVSYAGDIVQTSLERALVLVRATFAFAAEVPPAARLQPETLRDVVQEAADEALARHPDVTIHNLVEPERTVAMDRTQMLRVLGNLMRNAIEAGAGNLRIACTRTDRTALITVADDGPGLPEAVQQALFRPVTNGKPRGAGLGLAISRDLLRAMNGDLMLVQTGPDGVEFRITLAARPDGREN